MIRKHQQASIGMITSAWIKKALFFTLFLSVTFLSSAQVYTTQSAGDWSNPAIWLRDGIATLIPPTNANSSSITVSHPVIIGVANVIVDQTTITSTGTLTINSGFTFSVNNGAGTDLAVTGDVLTGTTIIINGGTFSNTGTANNTITFNNTTVLNNGSFTLTSGALTLSGTTSFSGVPNTGTTFFNSTISAGAVVTTGFGITSGGAMTVAGALTTNALFIASGAVTVSGAGSSFTANANYSTAGTLTVTNPGTFTAGATANGTITGNLAGTGTFTSNALVTFGGVTTVSGGGLKTFNNVTISGSVSASTTVNMVVNGDLINNGTINMSAGTVTLAGIAKTLSGTPVLTSFFDLTIAQSASITSSINFTTGDDLTIGGSLTTNSPFTTTGDLIVSGAIPAGSLIANSTFSVGALMSISGSATASAGFNAQGALTVTGVGSSLTSTGSSFSVGGTLTVSGSGTLQANAGFDAQGALTVTAAGSTFTANTVPFTVAGALTVNTSGNFTANADGTLSGNLAGTSTYTSTALTTFDNATTISGAGVKTLNNVIVTGSVVGTGSLLINGDLTNNGGSINPTAGTWTLSGTSKLLNGTSPTLTSFFALTIPQNMSRTSSIPFTAKSTLTIGGSLTTNAIFNANAALTIASAVPTGSLTANATFNAVGTVTVGGSLVANSGFAASGALTVSATTGSLTANNSPFSIGGILTVSGIFTANAGADLTLTSATGNNFVVAAAGTFSSLATVIFNGTTTMTQAGSRTFTNMRVNSGRSLLGGISFTLLGNIDNNGGTINFSAGTMTVDGASQIGGSPAPVLTRLFAVTINNTRSLLLLTDVTVDGNLAINGAIGANDGTTVTFLGLTMSGSGAGIKAFDNVNVGTGTFIPNVDYSITGDIQVTGTMQAGNATTSLTGTTSITGNATFNNLVIVGSLLSAPGTTTILHNLTNNGNCSLSTGTVQFSTSSTVQQVISGSQDITFNNLVVSNVGTSVDLTNEVDATRAIYLRGVFSFFENNSVFDADGLSNNRSFVLLSTNDDPASDATVGVIGTGSGITSGGATPSSVTVQRYMSTEGGSNSPDFDNGRIYRYISAPVNNPSVSQLQDDFYVTGSFPGADNGSTPGCTGCSTNPSLYLYNSSVPAYVAFAGGNLLRGVGYAAFIRNDLTPPGGGTPNMPIVIDYTGPINAGAVLNNTISSNPAVWNLVGNPYPSPIAWNNAGTGTTNIAAGIAVRDNSGPGGTFIPLTTGDKIATGQAFWVRANASGAAQLTFNEADKTSIAGTSFFRMSEEIKDELSLRVVRQDGIFDETIIRINRDAVGSVDTYDIPKKNGTGDLNNDYIDLTSVSTDGKSMLLNILPQVVCGQQIQLNFEDQLENGTVDLTTSQFNITLNTSGSLKALKWYLHDSHTGSVTDLTTTPVYNFTIDGTPGSAAKTRFYLTTESSAIDVSKQVTSSSLVCDGSSIDVSVMSTQNNMTYGLDVNGVYYPNLMKGNGGNKTIELDSEMLTDGNNTIKVKVNSGCTEEFLTTTVNIVKEALPQITSTTDGVLCATGSALISASGAPAGSTYSWYGSQLGGSVLATGEQFNTPVLSDSVMYYVSAKTSSGCIGPRVPVLAAVHDVSSEIALSKSVDVVCAGGLVVLSASNSEAGGSFKWHSTATSEDVLFTGGDYTTPALSASTSYFVSFVNQWGCESARKEVRAEVSVFAPAIHTESIQEKICVGGSHSFIASGAGTGAVYEWFDAIDATIPIIQSAVFETPALTETRTFYVRAKNELGCVTPMVAIQANVDTTDPSLGISQSLSQVCQNENFNIIPNGAPAGSTYRWYLKSNDIVSRKEGTSATWEDVNYSSVYYMSAVAPNGCEGSRKEIVLDVVNFVEAQIDSVSDGELVSNHVEGNQWYFEGVLLEGEDNQTITANRTGVYSLRVMIDGMCETWASRVNITALVTGTDEEIFSKGISVYPNPVQDRMQIQVSRDFDKNIILMDSQGRKVANIVLEESEEYKNGGFDMSGLARGFYYVRATKLNKPVFIKIIKR